jgi:hypothetical protein
MPQLLTPADIAKRLRAGEQQIFYDGTGARVAKAIGLEASVLAGDDAERSVDFHLDRRARPLQFDHRRRGLAARQLRQELRGAVGAR